MVGHTELSRGFWALDDVTLDDVYYGCKEATIAWGQQLKVRTLMAWREHYRGDAQGGEPRSLNGLSVA